jgi:cardiolipin synthase A/B
VSDNSQAPIQLLRGSQEYFPALIQAIDAAERSIYLESYLINNDPPTQEVLSALLRARSRGVMVHLLLDGFGAAQDLVWLDPLLRAAGVKIELYRPVVRWFLPSTWRRLHRKLVLIDEQMGFVGGINLMGDHFDGTVLLLEPRLDFAVRVTALRAVKKISWAMRRLWWRLSLRKILRESLRDLIRAKDRKAELVRVKRLWRRVRWHLRWRSSRVRLDASRRIRLFLRDNLRYRRAIEDWYLRRIGLARREVLIACAYFVPTLRFRRALIRAAARGVRVRLLLQGSADQWWTQWASQALTDELVGAGIGVFEYQPSFLHAKVAVIDDAATVGSSNIDPFSLMLSLEANIMIEDADFSQQLREQLEIAIAESTPSSGGLAVSQPGLRAVFRQLRLTVALMLLRAFLAVSGTRFQVR